MCVDEKTLYGELTERIAKAEYPSTDPTPRDPTPRDPTEAHSAPPTATARYSRKYKALVDEQKRDGIVSIVTVIADLCSGHLVMVSPLHLPFHR
jgi:hypothetical protein